MPTIPRQPLDGLAAGRSGAAAQLAAAPAATGRPDLLTLCQSLSEAPDDRSTLGSWAVQLGVSAKPSSAALCARPA